MNLDALKERLRKQYTDDIETEVVNGVLVVHLDNPDESEKKRRYVEVREGNFETDDDCALCQELKSAPPEVALYSKDSVLYLGAGPKGLIASAMSIKDKKDGSPAAGRTANGLKR